ALLTKDGGVNDTNALRKMYWRETSQERRKALLPFFWTQIATHGQLFGNQAVGSVVRVSNGKNFSYPGYNEIVTGIADPRVDSNDKKPNPNLNVFEWLNSRSQFKRKVAVFGSWDVFPYIFNIERSRLPIWPAWEGRFTEREIQVPKYLTELVRDTTPVWHDIIHDSFLFHAIPGYLKREKPRAVFIGFGETDEWAHAGRYDLYLQAAHLVDRFVKDLWERAQSMPQYRDKTTFIITADHGRGSGLIDWKSHGEKIAGSDGDWLAVIGPDTPALGERQQSTMYAQSQLAATIAALLGENFRPASPASGPPIHELLGKRN
ncbi:MAG: putative superfamily protein, partial [Verrucomicrobiales bacterium]|nr:putative superfamily protein [Verrucomicrobiales bacterium]